MAVYRKVTAWALPELDALAAIARVDDFAIIPRVMDGASLAATRVRHGNRRLSAHCIISPYDIAG